MTNPYMMMGLQHEVMPPQGAWAALRAAADLFGRVCAMCESIYGVPVWGRWGCT
jgi:hypothetical protein